MKDKIESLEKEKNADKIIRSRLEEECLKITKKHEEAVSLKLKLEEKLAILNSTALKKAPKIIESDEDEYTPVSNDK